MKALAAVLLALMLAGCGSQAAPKAKSTPSPSASLETPTKFEDVINIDCAYKILEAKGDTLQVADAGHSILIQAQTDQGYAAAVCILEKLHTSAALTQNIEATTSLMGRQTGTEQGMTYEWTYHPDNGLQMTIVEAK